MSGFPFGSGSSNGGAGTLLTGLVGDQGVTDNWAVLTAQLAAIAANGGGFAVLPYAPSGQYYGVSQDVVLPQGVWIIGQGPFRMKGESTSGHTFFGAALGPYHGAVFTSGVVQLVNPGTGLRDLTIVGAISPFFSSSAPAAVYVNGTGGSTSPRVDNCVLWGATIAALYIDASGNDFLISKSLCINNIAGTTQAVGASPSGLAVFLQTGSSDVRFEELQTFSAPVQLNGSDLMWVGGHISADGTAPGLPALYLNSNLGGELNNVTLDNGSSTLSQAIYRNLGTWIFTGCRFQNGAGTVVAAASNGNAINTGTLAATSSGAKLPASSTAMCVQTSLGLAVIAYTSIIANVLQGVTVVAGNPAGTVATGGAVNAYPIFTSNVDNSTGDPQRGLEVNGGEATNQSAFGALVQYSYTTAPAQAVDNLDGVVLEQGSMATAASGLATLWLDNYVFASAIIPTRATGIQYGNNGIVQPQIGTIGNATITTAAPATGVATQPNPVADTLNTLTVTTAATVFGVLIGPTNTPGQALVPSVATAPLGVVVQIPVPAGWWYKVNYTTGAISVATQNA